MTRGPSDSLWLLQREGRGERGGWTADRGQVIDSGRVR